MEMESHPVVFATAAPTIAALLSVSTLNHMLYELLSVKSLHHFFLSCNDSGKNTFTDMEISWIIT